jgi:hypothetical protein
MGTGGGTTCGIGAGANINATAWSPGAAGVDGRRTNVSRNKPAARCSSVAAPIEAADGRVGGRGPDRRVAATPVIGGPTTNSACRFRQYGTL